jgi:hypothetical protein
MTWLEPTRRCNITCDACFVENDPRGDKTLDEIRHELEVMLAVRHCDAMLVAGGEPLVHPRITEIVALVKSFGVKPVVVTNGVRLDKDSLRELKRAGAHGFTLHIDSHQHRPGWTHKTEQQLNDLRSHFADMLFAEGGMTCAFNTTVFPDTIDAIPDIVEWAVGRPDRVHVLTLICVRMAHPDDPYDYYVGDRKIDFESTPYVSGERYERLMTDDIYRQIREALPNFRFCAYLGGTVRPESLKWVIGCHIASRSTSYGQMGARSLEVLQNGHHMLRHRYLAFAPPRANRTGRAALLLSIVDPEMRRTAGKYFRAVLRNPRRLFDRLHVQTISAVQPVDVLPTGECDTCDGCPNKTFWNDRLVSACRVEEYRMYGAPVRLVPRELSESHALTTAHSRTPHSVSQSEHMHGD